MKVIKLGDAETYEPDKDWKRASICCEKEISVEHFVKPPGHSSPLHRHPNVQVIIVTRGQMAAVTEDEVVILNEGDCACFAANELHAVKNPLDEPATGIDIFVPGRSFDFWKNRKS